MQSEMPSDPQLSELLELHGRLAAAARRWSRGEPLGEETAADRRRAIEVSHLRYVARIAVYRQLAEEQGLDGAANLDAIVNQLMFTDELFKSYPAAWLRDGDFAAMTRWLQSLFAHPIPPACGEARDLPSWRSVLHRAGARLMYSSGTSGRMSFVPRDPLTWMAMVRNASSYADPSWWRDVTNGERPFDCLVAGPRGDGMGIQAAGQGLARLAARAHYLYDRQLGEADVQAAGAAGWGSSATEVADLEEPFRAAGDFLRRAAGEGRPVLVFGAPFHVHQLCRQLLQQGPTIRLTEDSILATGGGWKSFRGERVSPAELRRLAGESLHLAPERCLDSYSTSEINCTLVGCPADRYHIPPLIEPVVLDEAMLGTASREGTGNLGFLDPFAMSYPGFVVTGDLATLRQGACACGRSGWYLEGEITRSAHREVRGCGGVLASTIA